jgi:hypothetical protein
MGSSSFEERKNGGWGFAPSKIPFVMTDDIILSLFSRA